LTLAFVLGIIGGGQLGMMLAEAAKKMPDKISEVIVLDPNKNCSASKVGAKQIIADFKDELAIKELAEKSDFLTYEIELGNSKVLKEIENNVQINPSPETLEIIQDKLKQKTFLLQNNIPVADFTPIESLEELNSQITKFGFPVFLKARTDAYDGRGNFKINSKDEVLTAFKFFGNKPLMIEKFIDFKKELSVIAARNTKGEIATFPVVENIHEENILKITIAPARVSDSIALKAKEISEKTMKVLQGAGVFGIEMFLTKDDEILINEIAPRVHNSGHHTLQSSATSQFEQHLRAILGLELGSTELLYPTIMYNILGPKNFEGRYMPVKTHLKNIYLKMYGKEISKPKRKLGHFNFVDETKTRNIENMLQEIEEIKNSVLIKSV